ncbi:hypothetical protein RBSH_01585 [Rhodopirellula baltica SH28]|uniref:Uncharacterized protein n=1 Tax=Rhodopirellula baltica SH28 TaxID=993517 RepID=K5D827_RHOBT|nr:hypothetical protein RBSH_01585 [Rhodopirellula baltica SH28]
MMFKDPSWISVSLVADSTQTTPSAPSGTNDQPQRRRLKLQHPRMARLQS